MRDKFFNDNSQISNQQKEKNREGQNRKNLKKTEKEAFFPQTEKKPFFRFSSSFSLSFSSSVVVAFLCSSLLLVFWGFFIPCCLGRLTLKTPSFCFLFFLVGVGEDEERDEWQILMKVNQNQRFW